MNGELRLLLESVRAGNISLEDALPIVKRLQKGLMAENSLSSGELICCPAWKETPWNRSTRNPFAGRVLLFCGNSDDSAARFGQAISAACVRKDLILALPGIEYGSVSKNIYRVNPTKGSDLALLFQPLRDAGTLPEVLVLHDSFCRTGTIQSQRSILGEAEVLDMRGEIWPESLYWILQGLIQTKLHLQRRILFVYENFNRCTCPWIESLAGFSRSLQFLYPELKLATVEIQDRLSDGDVGWLVSGELRGVNPLGITGEIRYADGKRWIRRMERLDARVDSADRVLRSGNVYWVVGGFGRVGSLVAHYLARRYQARLFLTGRSPLDQERRRFVERWTTLGSEVLYIQADTRDASSMVKALGFAKERFGALQGVFHVASEETGLPVSQKSWNDFQRVMQPKTNGVRVLDLVTRDEPLEIFVGFSSIASILGDFAQCDYATGNCFLDSYIRARERLRKLGLRQGRSRTINWPLWESGGALPMTSDGESLYLRSAGMTKLLPERAFRFLENCLHGEEEQVALLTGDCQRLERLLELHHVVPGNGSNAGAASGRILIDNSVSISVALQNLLRQTAARLLKLDAFRLEPHEGFGSYGLDSVMLREFASIIGTTFGIEVNPSVFFAHNSIEQLSAHLINEYGHQIQPRLDALSEEGQPASLRESRVSRVPSSETIGLATATSEQIEWPPAGAPSEPNADIDSADIAIVGMSGILPGAADLEQFWENLVAGQDSVTEVPPDRWDWRLWFGDPLTERNKAQSRWGGFIRNVDLFDAAFFGLSAFEAENMDPQHRVFIEAVWKAVEDSGYRMGQLSGKPVGVFAGVEFSDYQHLLAKHREISALQATGTAQTMLANRVSYLFNFHGPSESVDTACSSSLVAVHKAVRSLRLGECSLAIAGGVSLMLIPETTVATGQLGVLSPDGRCKPFDEEANGYVRGEGVGVILLKPMQQAIADRDHIWAVIKGSAVNHGGRAHSLTAPNSRAQANLLVAAWQDAKIPFETATYLELHGTGTALGDPVEVDGIKEALRIVRSKGPLSIDGEGYCGLGSVKSNIGHLEPAAGIAGLLKTVLALRHRVIPASLHVRRCNPLIRLEDSPFSLSTATQPWQQLKDASGASVPRRAGVSSFGFGGANAHVVLEEFQETADLRATARRGPVAILLSAKTPERLKAYAKAFLESLESADSGSDSLSFKDLAFTLQVGRESLGERLAFVAEDVEEFELRLQQFLQGNMAELSTDGLSRFRSPRSSMRTFRV